MSFVIQASSLKIPQEMAIRQQQIDAAQAAPPTPASSAPSGEDSRPDYTNLNNTVIPADKVDAYNSYLNGQSRDVTKDLGDYDVQGFFLSGNATAANGHGTDTFKKPNHPTFSVESQYNGQDGKTGGAWSEQDGKTVFTPSPTNIQMYGEGALKDYFKRVEPDVVLNHAVVPGAAFDAQGIPKAMPVTPEQPIDAGAFDKTAPLPIFDNGRWSDESAAPVAPPPPSSNAPAAVPVGAFSSYSQLPVAFSNNPTAPANAAPLPQNAPNAAAVSQPKVASAPQQPAISASTRFTYGEEVRNDANGNPVLYHPPANDRGGSEEIAGFTSNHNPQELQIIKNTPPEQRMGVILQMMEKQTAPAAAWAADPGVQGLVRDISYHRGLGGAQAIIGMALGGPAVESSKITPQQVAALNAMPRPQAIKALTDARKAYEMEIYGDRKNLSAGLDNRFNQAAKAFLNLGKNGDQS